MIRCLKTFETSLPMNQARSAEPKINGEPHLLFCV